MSEEEQDEREKEINDSMNEMLNRAIEEELERRLEKKAEREMGVHFILKRLGFTVNTFKTQTEVHESAVVLGSTIHNELGAVARSQNMIVKETYTQFTIYTLIKLKELGIVLDGTNVDVWENSNLMKFRTKIDLVGHIVLPDNRKRKVMIELKTTTTDSQAAVNQIEHVTGRNEFPEGHPLKKDFKLNNTLTKALTQLFLMYRNARKKWPDVVPLLVYVFADDVKIFPFFTLFPQLQTEYTQSVLRDGTVETVTIDHIENLYRAVVFYYAKKYSTQLLQPFEIEEHQRLINNQML